MMTRDTLYLVAPGFEDPAYRGKTFYCWHCALLEGVLAGFPEAAARLDVVRVEWPRPRAAVIEAAGEENQSIPLLVLAEGARFASGKPGPARRWLVTEKDAILAALSQRHGFPEPHP